MSDIIVLDDDIEFKVSSSEVQRGLSEFQKSRMMQQKQLALARLQAKNLQRTHLPMNPMNVVPTVSPTSPQLGSRSWAGDCMVLASTSASNGRRAKPTLDEWQHSRLPNQGYHDHPSNSGPGYHFASGNADVRWDGRVDDRFGLACLDGNTMMVPNRNQDFWDADVHRATQDVSGSPENQKKSAHVPTEIIGEWRSVRKRPAPGNSFGIHMSVSSDHYKTSPRVFKSPRTLPGHGLSNSNRLQEPGSLQPALHRNALPNANTVPEEPRGALPTISQKEKPTPSKQQMEVLKAIAQRKSVFVTGSAGTGKSFIVEDALQILRRIHGEEAVFVTASTGLAACAIGGTTLHSFAGVGIGGNETKEELAEKVKKKREVRARWAKAKALIIDEISMIDGDLFEKLEFVARKVKGRAKGPDQVWGGLQLIVTGDFFQLEPVKPSNPQKYFAFQADCWNKSFDVQVELTHVFRQSDMEFVNMLNEIRRGVCSPATLHRLMQSHGPSDGALNGIEMTKLYPHQMDVRRENDQNLRAIGGDMIVYKAKDESHSDFGLRQLDNLRAVAVQPLCVGAQVILLKNLETGVGLVNGARGVVVGFSAPGDPAAAEYNKLSKVSDPPGQWPMVRFACDGLERLVGPESWSVFDGEKEIAKRVQIPLMLGWALSVHKCQGMTLDRVETNLSRAFGHGMVYVALSRVKSLQGLRLIGFDPSKIKALPVVARFYEGLNRSFTVKDETDDFDSYRM